MEQKERRFGRFNVVDIIAVALILAVLAFAGYKLVIEDSGASVGLASMLNVTYKVQVEDVPAEAYENCRRYIPSPMMASGELVNGEITGVEKQPYYVLGPDGQWVEHPEHVTLVFTATLQVPNDPVLTTKVGEQEVRVGKENHILKSEYIEFYRGTIIDVTWEEQE